MIYFVDYHLDSYIALIIDKFNYSIRTIYAPIGIASKGIPINDVNPPREIMHYFMIDDMETFRYYYLQYLESYKPLLSLIDLVLGEYYNNDVIVLTDLSNDYCCSVLECVALVINRRYGSNSIMINCIEDMNDCIFNANTSKEVKSNDCIQRFMNDKEWYYSQTINGKEKELLDNLDAMEDCSYGNMGE